MGSKWIRCGVAAVTLILGTAAPVAAGESVVTFRLTIRGTPDPTDSFTLAANPDNGLITDPGVLCGPGSDLYNPSHVPCEARSYEFEVPLPRGTEITYTYARHDAFLATGGFSGEQILLEGSTTVADRPQTVTLVYDYALGSFDGSSAPQPLPDTRVDPPPPLGCHWSVAAVLAPMLILASFASRRLTRLPR